MFVAEILRSEERSSGSTDDPKRNLLLAVNMGATKEEHGVYIFNRTDNGNVAPRAVVKGFNTKLNGCGGVAIDPKDGIIIGVGNNMYTAYLIPELFTDSFWQGKKTAAAIPGPRDRE